MKGHPMEAILREYNQIFKENNDLYREVTKSFGLPDTAFWILYALRDSEGMAAQREVCRLLYEPKQTINSALKKLESEGVIELVQGKDRRSKQIQLTAMGSELAERTADVVMAAEYQAFGQMDETDREAFLRLFRVYTENLKKKMGEAGLIDRKKKERDSKKK